LTGATIAGHPRAEEEFMQVKLIILVALLVSAWTHDAHAQRNKKTVTIGVVIDGPWERNADVRAVIEKEILDLTGASYDMKFPDEKRIVGDWTVDSVKDALDKLIADPQVDIVLAMGVLASNEAGQREKLAKPVLAPFVIDWELQGFPNKKGTSGRKNFTYLAFPWTIGRDLVAFKDIVDFTKVTVLSNKTFVDAVPGLEDRILETAKENGLDATVVMVESSAADALAKLPPGTEAVYVAPLLQLPSAEFDKLVQGLIDAKLPSFSNLGRLEVERGIMATIRPDTSFERVGRRLAVSVERILSGDEPSRFRVTLKLGESLVINMATSRAIGKSPSWAVLTEAELLNQKRENVDRVIGLDNVMSDALAGNPDLESVRDEIAVGKADVADAKSNLFPQVEFTTLGRVIDSDSAAGAAGTQPEFLWTAGITVTQLLYSEPALAGLAIQKDVQIAIDKQLEQSELDVLVDAGTAYLDVLRAKALERIEQENLRVTRGNLDLARTRKAVGNASSSEVYRWESKIANDRKSVIEASAIRNVSEIGLNRVLGRPVEESFDTKDAALDDPALLTSNKALFALVKDPTTFKLFRRFMLAEALANAPELEQFDAAISAQSRAVTSAERARWMPSVALQGTLDQRIVKAGTGAEAPMGFSSPPGLTWSLGVVVSFPIWSGGAKSAAIDRGNAELSKLSHDQEAVRQAVEQRVATAMHLAGASYAGIRLAREAAEAATKNLEIVTNSYSQGVLSIIELLDAQNAALVAQQIAANAVYDFLVDWLSVQRAVGRFDVLMNDADRDDFFRRANEFLAAERAKQ
jgi:outer membrane protein TolC/ABC-type uncharacterized transport system substrate-binding protein